MRQVQILTGREVPLGGVRAITVRRTLPSRERTLIGAWCFLDHYGPTLVGAGNDGGMDVPPHPHTGLQTISWLFSGEVEHRDSTGTSAMVRPGVLNLMTAGAGITHSEVSTPGVLHGAQLWVALPESSRHVNPGFEQFAPTPVALPAAAGSALVFLGELPAVASSPVVTATPLLGAELTLRPGAAIALAVDPTHEHGVLMDNGQVWLDGTELDPGDLGCRDPGRGSLTLRAGAAGARLLLLGGPPFDEEILMWWNFVARSQSEMEQFRREWQEKGARFGEVEGYLGEIDRVPAPPLPVVTLRPRGRRVRREGAPAAQRGPRTANQAP
ncbi:MAG: pirin family protein [Nostocoides sp.]